MKKISFNFWLQFFILSNWVAVAVGLVTAFAGNSILMELHNEGTSDVFFQGEKLPEGALLMKNWLFGIIGASIVGFQLVLIFIAKNAIAKREKWAIQAAWIGILSWFLIDSGITVFYGAWHNMWIINLPAFIALSVPLWMLTFYSEK